MLCLLGHSGMFTHSVQKHCVNEGKKQEVVVSPLVMLQLTWAAGGIFMIRWAFINLFISLNICVFSLFVFNHSLLSLQPVIADDCPSLSLVLL